MGVSVSKKREKIFGLPARMPVDRNAKARIMAYAKGWNASHRKPGQHTGPLTRATFDVLRALLWQFCNAKSGACFPGYERIAEAAECCRDTVREAIKALESADVLTWVHRLRREGSRVKRTSNGYVFRVPAAAETPAKAPKTENPSGTHIQDSKQIKIIILDPADPFDAALVRLGRSAGAIGGARLAA